VRWSAVKMACRAEQMFPLPCLIEKAGGKDVELIGLVATSGAATDPISGFLDFDLEGVTKDSVAAANIFAFDLQVPPTDFNRKVWKSIRITPKYFINNATFLKVNQLFVEEPFSELSLHIDLRPKSSLNGAQDVPRVCVKNLFQRMLDWLSILVEPGRHPCLLAAPSWALRNKRTL
jgi:hypothetical protein